MYMHMVKSGNFRHRVNLDLQTVQIQMRQAVSSGFSQFAYSQFIFLFQLLKYKTNKIAVQIYLMSEVTLLILIFFYLFFFGGGGGHMCRSRILHQWEGDPTNNFFY